MNVLQIITRYLIDNNHGGLYSPSNECGCEVGDLAPCGEIGGDCVASKRIECPDPRGCGCRSFHIVINDESIDTAP